RRLAAPARRLQLAVGDVPRRVEIPALRPRVCVCVRAQRLEPRSQGLGSGDPLSLRRPRDGDVVRLSAIPGNRRGICVGRPSSGGCGVPVRIVLYAASTLHASELVETARRLRWEIAASVRNLPGAAVPAEVPGVIDLDELDPSLLELEFAVPQTSP